MRTIAKNIVAVALLVGAVASADLCCDVYVAYACQFVSAPSGPPEPLCRVQPVINDPVFLSIYASSGRDHETPGFAAACGYKVGDVVGNDCVLNLQYATQENYYYYIRCDGNPYCNDPS